MLVIRGGFDGLSLSGTVAKLVNEIEALRQTGRSWSWIAERLAEVLGHPVSSSSACTVFSRTRKAVGVDPVQVEQAKKMLDEGLEGRPMIRIESSSASELPAKSTGSSTSTASPVARPETSKPEEKAAAASAAGRPLKGARPSGNSVQTLDASGEKPVYLSYGKPEQKFDDGTLGVDKYK
jgi:hypothetical protein